MRRSSARLQEKTAVKTEVVQDAVSPPRRVASVSSEVPVRALGAGAYELRSMKAIADEDHYAGRKRKQSKQGNDEDEEEEDDDEDQEDEREEKQTTKKKKKSAKKAKKAKKLLSTSQEARQRLMHTTINQQRQMEQCQIDDPVENQEFLRMLQTLKESYPVFHSSLDQLHRGESTQAMLDEVLNTPRPVLHVRTAQHESRMLKEAGRFADKETGRVVLFPACNRGEFCVASACYRSIGLDAPIILMASMDEDAYKTLLTDGELPDYSALCVLCYRYTLKAAVEQDKLLRMQNRPTPLQRPTHETAPLMEAVMPAQVYYNLKDAVGGYRGEFMSEQRFNQACTFPIVEPNLSQLTASTERGTGRIVIEQRALLYEPVVDTSMAPPVGTTVKVFLGSSMKATSPARVQVLVAEQKGRYLREQIRAYLLRHQTLDPDVRKLGLDSIDRLQVEFLSQNSNVSPKLSFICAQLLDVIQAMQEEKTGDDRFSRHIPWTELEACDRHWGALCTDVLLDPSLSVFMQNAAFFSPLADLSVPMLQLITKCCVNVRCQCRTFANMVRVWLVSLKRARRVRRKGKQVRAEQTVVETFVLRVCIQMVGCGLLGNYAHSQASTRPPAHARLFIYKLMNEARYQRWWVRLFEHSVAVLVNCVRSAMIWTLDHNPAILRNVHGSDLLNYPLFKTITETAMGVLRLQFAELILNPCSGLYANLHSLPSTPCAAIHLWRCGHKSCRAAGRCIRKRVGGMDPSVVTQDMKNDELSGWVWSKDVLHQELSSRLDVYEVHIKAISYRRPANIATKLLRPMRRDFGLIPYQREVRVGPATPQEEDVEWDDGAETKEERDIDRYLFPDNKSSPYLPDSHLYAARAIVAHAGPVGYGDPFPRVLQFLPFFGVSHECAREIAAKLAAYQDQSEPGQRIQRWFWALRTRDPGAYNLIHIFSELLEQAQRRMRMVDLPMHILQAQIEGLQQSRRVSNAKALLDSSISFSFCHVCFHVNAHVQDAHSCYKNTFEVGVLKASHSYLENKTYCKNRRVNHRGVCGQQELVRVPLLGRMLWFRQKMLMICPQPHCGQVMAFDPKEETYVYQNERGPACITCTQKMGVRGDAAVNTLLRQHHMHRAIRCVHCTWPNERIKENWRAHIYGNDRYICHRHHNPEMDKVMKAELAALPRSDAALLNRCVDTILALYQPPVAPASQLSTSLAHARQRDWHLSESDYRDRVVVVRRSGEEEEQEEETQWV